MSKLPAELRGRSYSEPQGQKQRQSNKKNTDGVEEFQLDPASLPPIPTMAQLAPCFVRARKGCCRDGSLSFPLHAHGKKNKVS